MYPAKRFANGPIFKISSRLLVLFVDILFVDLFTGNNIRYSNFLLSDLLRLWKINHDKPMSSFECEKDDIAKSISINFDKGK